MVYLFILMAVFVSTTFLYYAEEYTIKISNKKANKALVLLAPVIPTIASARGIIDVGDTPIYV